MAGADDLINQLNRKEAIQRNQGSSFVDAFTPAFQQGFGQQRQFDQRSQLQDQKLQNELMLQQFQQNFKQQQSDQMAQVLGQATNRTEENKVTPTTTDTDSSEVSILDKRMGSIQGLIDQLSRFAGNPQARVKIDSLREEQKRVQKRIDRVRDRKIKREDIAQTRIGARLDKLNDLGGSINPGALKGLPAQDQIDIINAEISAFGQAKAQKLGDTTRKDLISSEALSLELDELIGILGGPDSTFAQAMALLPAAAGSEQGQRFDLLKTSIGDRLLRLRSGAQINEQEFARFMKLLPSLFRRDKVDLEQLRKFKKEFASIAVRINQGIPGGAVQNPGPQPPQNNEALKWAIQNPNDPRAAQILQKLGVQ